MREPSEILPRAAAPDEVLRAAGEALAEGAAVAIATVIERQGSAPSTPGQKLALVRRERASEREEAAIEALGTIGGGAIEHAVVRALLESLEGDQRDPHVETFRLGPSLGMCCGGSVRVLLETLRPRSTVLLVGAGHVGRATAHALVTVGFRVVVVDARAEAASELQSALAADPRATVPGAKMHCAEVVCAEHDDPETIAALRARPEASACVVMTHDHQLDQRAIEWAIERGFRFVGGVGSRAKAERTRQRLEARGFPERERDRVRMPVGLSIGARSPEEIAIAITAELIADRAAVEGRARSHASRPAASPASAEAASIEAE
jgi:xanthine dehydrogenase accessory factor